MVDKGTIVKTILNLLRLMFEDLWRLLHHAFSMMFA